jgi:hypothetical protein
MSQCHRRRRPPSRQRRGTTHNRAGIEPVTSVLQPPEPAEYDALEYAALPVWNSLRWPPKMLLRSHLNDHRWIVCIIHELGVHAGHTPTHPDLRIDPCNTTNLGTASAAIRPSPRFGNLGIRTKPTCSLLVKSRTDTCGFDRKAAPAAGSAESLGECRRRLHRFSIRCHI